MPVALCNTLILILNSKGQICDKDSHDIPPNTSLTSCKSNHGPEDWTPYNNHTEFETANFIYHQNQMSAGDIDTLTALWAATFVPHGTNPPFTNHTDLYNTIDFTPLRHAMGKLQFAV